MLLESINILQTILQSVLLFFFGASIGSFVMVASQRLRVKNFLNNRSVCMSCNNILSWKELVPVFSYLYLRGKCKYCKSKINISLFLVELFSGLIFIFLPYVINIYTSNFYLSIAIFVLFAFVYIFSLFTAIYDIKHKIINLESLIVLFFLSIISQISVQYFDDNTGISYLNLLSPVFTSFIFIFIYIISRGRWMGLGDIFLYFIFGAMLPLPIAISGVFYSVWIGAVFSLVLFTFNHKYHMKSEIPFAPFIILGFLYSFMTYSDLMNITFLF
jgi:leader peptidase (prepilin peptidase)/N-methyltransferase